MTNEMAIEVEKEMEERYEERIKHNYDDLEIKETLDKYESLSLEEIKACTAPEESPKLFKRNE